MRIADTKMSKIEIVINSTRVMGVRVTISCRYALSLMGRCFCYRQDCPVAANCRYCFYSQAKNHVFRPAEATRCTDSGQTLQDWRAPGSAWPCKISRQSVRRAGNAATKNYKIPLFGKKSPRMTLTLDRFLKFLGSFICLKLCDMSFSNFMWFASQVTELLLRNRPSVN